MARANAANAVAAPGKRSLAAMFRRDIRLNYDAYLLIIPVIIFYLVFCYKPMYGLIIAFKDYSPGAGILGSDWIGIEHFRNFFGSYYFTRILRNTVVISLGSIIFGFPAPVLLALMLNEIRSDMFRRVTQTVSYMPHFISQVVVCSLVHMFTSNTGVLTSVMPLFGLQRISLLSQEQYFVPIYVLSGIWQEIGWGAIIYLAALTSIDQQLYEAARIDGAGRWKQTLHVTLPGISGTVIIMLLLRLGSVMNVGFEKIILLYNPSIYETADVISTFVYRKGLSEFQWSYSAAVGLFNSIINFALIIAFNGISRKASEVSLW